MVITEISEKQCKSHMYALHMHMKTWMAHSANQTVGSRVRFEPDDFAESLLQQGKFTQMRKGTETMRQQTLVPRGFGSISEYHGRPQSMIINGRLQSIIINRMK